jgi:uncharacterized protein YigA (DUF484 family)
MDLPKDKKHALPSLPASQPAAPALGPSHGKGGLSAGEIASYLKQHPDFLNEHPDLLGVLTPPKLDRGERVIDMQHFMVQHQRNEITRLKAQNKSLVSATRANLMGQARVHAAALAIIGAQSFEQLIQIVITDLAGLLDADVVTIAVERQGGARAKMPHHGIEILEPGTVAEVLGEERDVVFQTDIQGDPRLFGVGAGLVRSAALVRLPVGRASPAGMLCIGTRRAGKFQTGHQSTELLSFLARTLGITIAAWLDLPA